MISIKGKLNGNEVDLNISLNLNNLFCSIEQNADKLDKRLTVIKLGKSNEQ